MCLYNGKCRNRLTRRQGHCAARRKENTIIERRTRIVATLGPAMESPEMLDAILQQGVNGVRINFSCATILGPRVPKLVMWPMPFTMEPMR